MSRPSRQPPLTEPTLLILAALWAGALHGYGIRAEVRRPSKDRVRLGNGTVYESLPRLEQLGWIAAAAETGGGQHQRDRRPYELTDQGREALRSELARLCQLCDLLLERGVERCDTLPPRPEEG